MPTRRTIVSGMGATILIGLMPNRLAAQSDSFDALLAQLGSDESLSSRRESALDLEDQKVLLAQIGTKGPAPRKYRRDDLKISPQANALIVAAEVTGKQAYERKNGWHLPAWPGGLSGVTVGIGYDIGYTQRPWIKNEWGAYVSPAMIAQMQSACGVYGKPAKALAAHLKASVDIGWTAALDQFGKVLLPLYIGETVRTCPGSELLPPDCLGALVSLVFNRGGSFGVQGSRYKEMRAIAAHINNQELDRIPAEILSMKRLWRGKGLPGLLTRRDAEAALFARGLRGIA